jgi:hypothetical protein
MKRGFDQSTSQDTPGFVETFRVVGGSYNPREFNRLSSLHTIAVKAAQKYESATSGTETKKKLAAAWMRAEAKFTAALSEHL